MNKDIKLILKKKNNDIKVTFLAQFRTKTFCFSISLPFFRKFLDIAINFKIITLNSNTNDFLVKIEGVSKAVRLECQKLLMKIYQKVPRSGVSKRNLRARDLPLHTSVW